MSENDWNQYKMLILSNLEDIKGAIESNNNELKKINQEIATLKVKSGVWGMLGGAIPVLVMVVANFVNK